MKMQEAFEGLIEGKWKAVRTSSDVGLNSAPIRYNKKEGEFYYPNPLVRVGINEYYLKAEWEVYDEA